MFSKKHAGRELDSEAPRCSFCSKKQTEVGKLIAGPTAFICEECVQVCVDIIENESGPVAEAREGEPPRASKAPAPEGVGPVSAPCVVCDTLTPTAGLLWLPDRGGLCWRCVSVIEAALAAREPDSNS